MRGRNLEAPRASLPHHRALDRRHGFCRAKDLRHRGLAAGAGRLSRNQLLLIVRRFPGSPHACALPPERLQEHAIRPHVERLRRRRRPRFDRRAGELPGSGWAGPRARSAQALYGLARKDRSRIAMRILITNDDGIEAAGLDVLEKIATDLSDDVWVIAPETDQSGAAHSLTLAEPLRMRELAPRRYAVKGTPTDCVIMGVRFLLADQPPDLVLSGVNRGQNLADDVNYSGTVAGAIEAALLGIPSIAMSLVTEGFERGAPQWETPMRHGASLVRRLLEARWPEDVVLNVNFPDCAPDEVKGMAATVQDLRSVDQVRIEDRMDTMGSAYYWIGIERRPSKPPEGTDLWAARSNLISVTPLYLNFTHEETRRRPAKVLGNRT